MKTFEKCCTLFCVWEKGRKESGKKQVTGYTPCHADVIKKCSGHCTKVSEQNGGGGREMEEGKRKRRREKEVGRRIQSAAEVQSPHPTQENPVIFIDLRTFGVEKVHISDNRWRCLRCVTLTTRMKGDGQ